MDNTKDTKGYLLTILIPDCVGLVEAYLDVPRKSWKYPGSKNPKYMALGGNPDHIRSLLTLTGQDAERALYGAAWANDKDLAESIRFKNAVDPLWGLYGAARGGWLELELYFTRMCYITMTTEKQWIYHAARGGHVSKPNVWYLPRVKGLLRAGYLKLAQAAIQEWETTAGSPFWDRQESYNRPYYDAGVQMACRGGHLPCVEYMSNILSAHIGGEAWVKGFTAACKGEHLEVVVFILTHQCPFHNNALADGLMEAVKRDYLSIFEVIETNLLLDENRRNELWASNLSRAISISGPKTSRIVQWLWDRVTVGTRWTRTCKSRVIDALCKANNVDMLEKMRPFADIDFQETVQTRSAHHGNLHMLQRFPIPLGIRQKNVLYAACAHGRVNIIQYLLPHLTTDEAHYGLRTLCMLNVIAKECYHLLFSKICPTQLCSKNHGAHKCEFIQHQTNLECLRCTIFHWSYHGEHLPELDIMDHKKRRDAIDLVLVPRMESKVRNAQKQKQQKSHRTTKGDSSSESEEDNHPTAPPIKKVKRK